MRHPRGLDFANERLVYHLRKDQGKTWETIAEEVRNIANEPSTPDTVRRAYLRFRCKEGKSKYKFASCGRRPWKLTPAIQKYLLQKLLALRKKKICTSTTLQALLAKERRVNLADSAIRKFLFQKGYKWSPRSQKRVYSEQDMGKRLRFARRWARLSDKDVQDKLDFSLDGIVLTIPPDDPVERQNFCKEGETHMWRKPNEAAMPALAGGNNYSAQIPLARALPMWGGISGGGAAVVVFHKTKKLKVHEWTGVINKGQLLAAVRSLKPRRKAPWHILCDNERFLHAEVCRKACAKRKLKLCFVPPRSPDLNPVERFWSWLRKELRRRDLLDLNQGKPVLNKAAYRTRVRKVINSKKAQRVAKNIAKGFKRVCKIVVKLDGAHSGK